MKGINIFCGQNFTVTPPIYISFKPPYPTPLRSSSVCSVFLLHSLKVCCTEFGSHWTDFSEIRYLSIFLKYVQEIQVSLEADKNNGYFT